MPPEENNFGRHSLSHFPRHRASITSEETLGATTRRCLWLLLGTIQRDAANC